MDIAEVILVDENDQELGVMEKMEAHHKGLLHRAFSVFIMNSTGEMLLQQRALSKYHSPGLWTNACCSHPAPGESTLMAAHRRLKEEMGFDCPLSEVNCFTYQTTFDNGLIEHEFDHILLGLYNCPVYPVATEVQEHKWISIPNLEQDCSINNQNYTFWFHLAYPHIKSWLGS